MKKLLLELIAIWILFFGISTLIHFFQNGQTLTYEIKDSKYQYTVVENYTKRQKGNDDGYFFEVKTEDESFVLQTYENFQKKQHVIVRIDTYEDENVMCILPVAKKNRLVSDLICKQNGVQVYYQSLKGTIPKLDEYVSQHIELQKLYQNHKNSDAKMKQGASTFYPKNIKENDVVFISDYRGLLRMNPSGESQKLILFSEDVYEQKIHAFTDDYYVVANYEQPYEVTEFYVVNLKTMEQSKILTRYEISKNSEIQGVIDGKIYLYDHTNQSQYEIDPKKELVTLVGNPNLKIQYYNGNDWEEKEMYEVVNQKIYFENYKKHTKEFTKYEKVIQVGGDLTGYYYFFEKEGDAYRVYRAPVQKKKAMNYLFTTTDTRHITYQNDVVYYKQNNRLYQFSDVSGSRMIVENSELEFNPTILFGVARIEK